MLFLISVNTNTECKYRIKYGSNTMVYSNCNAVHIIICPISMQLKLTVTHYWMFEFEKSAQTAVILSHSLIILDASHCRVLSRPILKVMR